MALTTANSSQTIPPGSSAPKIEINPPAEMSVLPPAGVTFKASASGRPRPTVVWQWSANGTSGWSPIGGATSATYVIPETTDQPGKFFRAVFTNASGSAATTACELKVGLT